MPDYKNARLELKVYEDIQARMQPRESMSQTMERLLAQLDEARGLSDSLNRIFGEVKIWSTPKRGE